MLGEYALQFEAFLSQNDYDFDRAVELMADWVVDPKNADEYGVLPREKMISYIVHPSAFKNGLTGLLDYDIYQWYGSAALPEYLPFTAKIWKQKP